MSKIKRRKFSPEEKFTIVKQVLSKTRTVSEIADEYGIHPNLYYRWQGEFFEGALNVFKEKSLGRTRSAEEREKRRMQEEIDRMKNVIAEIVSDNIELKKSYRNSCWQALWQGNTESDHGCYKSDYRMDQVEEEGCPGEVWGKQEPDQQMAAGKSREAKADESI